MAPNETDPMAPIPKANPTVKPAIVPTFPGTNSCAYITVTEKLLIIMNPAINNKIKAVVGGTNGKSAVIGMLAAKEKKMMFLRPNLSASGPPKKYLQHQLPKGK